MIDHTYKKSVLYFAYCHLYMLLPQICYSTGDKAKTYYFDGNLPDILVKLLSTSTLHSTFTLRPGHIEVNCVCGCCRDQLQ